MIDFAHAFKEGDVIGRRDRPVKAQDLLDVSSVEPNGDLTVFPRGGGFQMKIPATAAYKYEAVDANSFPFRKSLFCFYQEKPFYEGWTDGSLWNGWAKPYFEEKVARKILKIQNAHDLAVAFFVGRKFKALGSLVAEIERRAKSAWTIEVAIEKIACCVWDEKGEDLTEKFGVVIQKEEPDHPEVFLPEFVIKGNGNRAYPMYPIGTGSWTWEEVHEDTKKEHGIKV